MEIARAENASGMVLGRNGYFYGATDSSIFEVAPRGDLITWVNLSTAAGEVVVRRLVAAGVGRYLAVTEAGGCFGGGTIMEVILPTVADPVFNNVSAGKTTTSTTVTITSPTAGAVIHYTLDGSAPSLSNGELYIRPLQLSVSTTVRAIAYKQGWDSSAVVDANYEINPQGGGSTPPDGGLDGGMVVIPGTNDDSHGSGSDSGNYDTGKGIRTGQIKPVGSSGGRAGSHSGLNGAPLAGNSTAVRPASGRGVGTIREIESAKNSQSHTSDSEGHRSADTAEGGRRAATRRVNTDLIKLAPGASAETPVFQNTSPDVSLDHPVRRSIPWRGLDFAEPLSACGAMLGIAKLLRALAVGGRIRTIFKKRLGKDDDSAKG
jgi:hypothetical protein